MEQPNKPIKRTAELAPLSRDHHEGLLLGWKLQQGIKHKVAAARMAAYVKWFWPVHLEPHFQKEETFLPPLLPDGNPLIQQMLAEHIEIEKMVASITENATYAEFIALGDMVKNHIRFEERILFNEVEKSATPEQLQQLATQLTDAEVEAKWEDNFWQLKK